MTIDNEIKKGITKGDIILIACVILLIAVLFLLPFKGSDKKLTAEIYAHGEKTHSIALSEVGESYTLRINHCELLIEKDGVTFLTSDCADQLCVKKGKCEYSAKDILLGKISEDDKNYADYTAFHKNVIEKIIDGLGKSSGKEAEIALYKQKLDLIMK